MWYLIVGALLWILIGASVGAFFQKSQGLTTEDVFSIIIIWPFIFLAIIFIAMPCWGLMWLKDSIKNLVAKRRK